MPGFAPAPVIVAEIPKPQAGAGKPKKAGVRSTFELLVATALSDLIKRKKARPSTAKKLLSTIHAKCGKSIPDNEIEAVLNELIKRGYVVVNGSKVSYQLPEELPG